MKKVKLYNLLLGCISLSLLLLSCLCNSANAQKTDYLCVPKNGYLNVNDSASKLINAYIEAEKISKSSQNFLAEPTKGDLQFWSAFSHQNIPNGKVVWNQTIPKDTIFFSQTIQWTLSSTINHTKYGLPEQKWFQKDTCTKDSWTAGYLNTYALKDTIRYNLIDSTKMEVSREVGGYFIIRQAIDAQYPIVINGMNCFDDTATFYVDSLLVDGMNYRWSVPVGFVSDDTTKTFIKIQRDLNQENKNLNLKFTVSVCGGTKDTVIEIKARMTKPKIVLASSCIPTTDLEFMCTIADSNPDFHYVWNSKDLNGDSLAYSLVNKYQARYRVEKNKEGSIYLTATISCNNKQGSTFVEMRDTAEIHREITAFDTIDYLLASGRDCFVVGDTLSLSFSNSTLQSSFKWMLLQGGSNEFVRVQGTDSSYTQSWIHTPLSSDLSLVQFQVQDNACGGKTKPVEILFAKRVDAKIKDDRQTIVQGKNENFEVSDNAKDTEYKYIWSIPEWNFLSDTLIGSNGYHISVNAPKDSSHSLVTLILTIKRCEYVSIDTLILNIIPMKPVFVECPEKNPNPPCFNIGLPNNSANFRVAPIAGVDSLIWNIPSQWSVSAVTNPFLRKINIFESENSDTLTRMVSVYAKNKYGYGDTAYTYVKITGAGLSGFALTTMDIPKVGTPFVQKVVLLKKGNVLDSGNNISICKEGIPTCTPGKLDICIYGAGIYTAVSTVATCSTKYRNSIQVSCSIPNKPASLTMVNSCVHLGKETVFTFQASSVNNADKYIWHLPACFGNKDTTTVSNQLIINHIIDIAYYNTKQTISVQSCNNYGKSDVQTFAFYPQGGGRGNELQLNCELLDGMPKIYLGNANTGIDQKVWATYGLLNGISVTGYNISWEEDVDSSVYYAMVTSQACTTYYQKTLGQIDCNLDKNKPSIGTFLERPNNLNLGIVTEGRIRVEDNNRIEKLYWEFPSGWETPNRNPKETVVMYKVFKPLSAYGQSNTVRVYASNHCGNSATTTLSVQSYGGSWGNNPNDFTFSCINVGGIPNVGLTKNGVLANQMATITRPDGSKFEDVISVEANQFGIVGAFYTAEVSDAMVIGDILYAEKTVWNTTFRTPAASEYAVTTPVLADIPTCIHLGVSKIFSFSVQEQMNATQYEWTLPNFCTPIGSTTGRSVIVSVFIPVCVSGPLSDVVSCKAVNYFGEKSNVASKVVTAQGAGPAYNDLTLSSINQIGFQTNELRIVHYPENVDRNIKACWVTPTGMFSNTGKVLCNREGTYSATIDNNGCYTALGTGVQAGGGSSICLSAYSSCPVYNQPRASSASVLSNTPEDQPEQGTQLAITKKITLQLERKKNRTYEVTFLGAKQKNKTLVVCTQTDDIVEMVTTSKNKISLDLSKLKPGNYQIVSYSREDAYTCVPIPIVLD